MNKHPQKKLEFLIWTNDPVGTVRGVFAPRYSEQLVTQLAAVRSIVSDQAVWDKSPLGVLYRKLSEALK